MSIRLAQTGDQDFDVAQLPSSAGRWLVDVRSSQDGHWVAWLGEKGEWLAAARVARAESSAFAELSGLAPARLDQSIALEAVWLAREADGAELLPGLLYAALRTGRVWARNAVVSYLENLDTLVGQTAHLETLRRAPRVTAGGKEMEPVAQLLEVALHHTAQACSPATWTVIQPTLVREVTDYIKLWLQRFGRGAWATSIRNGTISREQYVASLQNLHHYVRQTTRHIARSISHSDDRRLRNHYIEHLKGEINHELTIERDLKQLGIDPDYVIHDSIPSTSTREFQAIQEATIGYHQDPVLMMANPLAAEGVTAHITPDFIEALRKTVASWGVDKPERAMGFLISHTDYDGGEDGHFAMTVATLQHYLTDERIQRRFMTTLAVSTDTIERSFNSSVDDNKLFSSTL